MINGQQCIFIWRTDDIKLSHLEKKVAEDIIAQFNKKSSKESLLTTTVSRVLEYLGLTMDYSKKGKGKISMYKYIKKMLC